MSIDFRAWLHKYCSHLANATGESFENLAAKMLDQAPHGIEALFLYAIEIDRIRTLLDLAPSEKQSEWRLLAKHAEPFFGDALSFAKVYREQLPRRYRAVIDAFDEEYLRNARDEEVVTLMGRDTAKLLNKHGIDPRAFSEMVDLDEKTLLAWIAGKPSSLNRPTASVIWRQAMSLADDAKGSERPDCKGKSCTLAAFEPHEARRLSSKRD